MQQRSPILVEIAWLAYFLAIFVILIYVFNLYVVPHHFNDKVAAAMAGVLAALAMIFTRAAYTRRNR